MDRIERESIIAELREEEPDTEYLMKWAIEQHEAHNVDEIDLVIAIYKFCADHGDAVAMNNLGAIYYEGTYINQNYKKALHYYEEAANHGNAVAFCNMGYIYLYGRLGEKDYAKAFECYMNGAALIQDGNCYYKLGDMYRYGNFVEKNDDLAFQYYLMASNAENHYMEEYQSDVSYRLANCFHEGIGCEVNEELALMYYMNARNGYLNRIDDPFGYVAPRIREITDKIIEIMREQEENA